MNPVIIYEDQDVLAVNKPSGMVVNKADTTKGDITVQEWAEEYLHIPSGALTHERDDYYNRGGIVHRLDKETSGVLLIAKSPEAFHALQAQFKDRTITKSYRTLVHGVVTPAVGEITVPIGRLPWNRMRFGVIADGREAFTQYSVERMYQLQDKKKEKLSFLHVFPKTGRTHQIRVHMKHINHPIFSDFLYAGRKTSRDDRKYLERVFLHASEITFLHPTTHQKMTLLAPLAPELSIFLQQHCAIID